VRERVGLLVNPICGLALTAPARALLAVALAILRGAFSS
jgi:hypothetical protein